MSSFKCKYLGKDFVSMWMFFYFCPFVVQAALKIRLWERERKRGKRVSSRKACLRIFHDQPPLEFPAQPPVEFRSAFSLHLCAQCQEVSRPEFTLTHSIRSFVRAGKKFVRSTEGRAGFAVIFIPPLRVARSLFCICIYLVFIVVARRRCQVFTTELWHDIIVFC